MSRWLLKGMGVLFDGKGIRLMSKTLCSLAMNSSRWIRNILKFILSASHCSQSPQWSS